MDRVPASLREEREASGMIKATGAERLLAEHHVLLMMSHGARIGAEVLNRHQSPLAERFLDLAEKADQMAQERTPGQSQSLRAV